jgi:hypothetical protein
MARVIGLILESEIAPNGRSLAIPAEGVLDVLGIDEGDDIEVRLTWEGSVADGVARLSSRRAIELTPEWGELPPTMPVTVTIWRMDQAPGEVAGSDEEKGWWAQDGGADFATRAAASPEPLRGELHRLVDWARGLEVEGSARLFSYRNAGASMFTLLPYLPQHDAGLITIWNTGAVTFARTVFDLFAPEYIPRVEAVIGAPLRQRTKAPDVSDELLALLRDAYASASRMPPVGEWNDARFDAVFTSAVGSTEILDRLRGWAQEHGVAMRYGGGASQGPLHFNVSTPQGDITLFSLNAGGSVLFNVRGGLDRAHAFASPEQRRQLLADFAAICGVTRRDESADTWYTLPLRAVTGERIDDLVGLMTNLHRAVTGDESA